MQEFDSYDLDVSIIIPTYNEGHWLKRTVESIQHSKTRLLYEVLVVDDGCTDGSIDPIVNSDDVKVISTGGKQLGLIVGKNAGAAAARGKYLCFLDSHVLVHNYWIDYLRETADTFAGNALVSGNLPSVNQFVPRNTPPRQQFGYTITNRIFDAGWYFHDRDFIEKPYLQPLTPGGLMFTSKQHFLTLGGFAAQLRKWGAEDIEISLKNYYLGGDSVVDPRVIIYHYYKEPGQSKWATREQLAFNYLYVASIYFPQEYYLSIRDSLVRTRWFTPPFIAELESIKHRASVAHLHSRFVRGFDNWTAQFPCELRKFLNDTEAKIRQPSSSLEYSHARLPVFLQMLLSFLKTKKA